MRHPLGHGKVLDEFRHHVAAGENIDQADIGDFHKAAAEKESGSAGLV